MQKPSALEQLQRHHPLIIEGMSGYDKRDPLAVASIIVRQLTDRWTVNPPTKPVLLVTQGDPYEERGISAITRLVADSLGVFRALIVLDAAIADYHSPNADRYKNICEISYSTAYVLQTDLPGALTAIEDESTRLTEKMRDAPRRKACATTLLPRFCLAAGSHQGSVQTDLWQSYRCSHQS